MTRSYRRVQLSGYDFWASCETARGGEVAERARLIKYFVQTVLNYFAVEISKDVLVFQHILTLQPCVFSRGNVFVCVYKYCCVQDLEIFSRVFACMRCMRVCTVCTAYILFAAIISRRNDEEIQVSACVHCCCTFEWYGTVCPLYAPFSNAHIIALSSLTFGQQHARD